MRYGSDAYADLDAVPYVFFDQNQVTAEYVDTLRLSYEISHAHNAPEDACVMFDGSLVWWGLAAYQDMCNAAWRTCTHLYNTGTAYVGYISASRSRNLCTLLTYLANGDICDHRHVSGVTVPTDTYVTDTMLYSTILPDWYRTPFFTSSHAFIQAYPAHVRPYFSYWNIGSEVVRIEMPYWLVCDEGRRESVLAIVRNQIEKGHGYPSALTEAHEAAVIRESDRQFFFQTIAHYTGNTSLSRKQERKYRPAI